MSLNRREFIVLSSAILIGCDRQDKNSTAASTSPATPASAPAEEPLDAGPVAAFEKDDVYDSFREQGFLVIRRDKKLFVLSSVCTHKGCKVRVADDLSFYCKCHHSEFDKDGKVTKGPATRNLPRLAVALDDRQHVLVDLNQPLDG